MRTRPRPVASTSGISAERYDRVEQRLATLGQTAQQTEVVGAVDDERRAGIAVTLPSGARVQRDREIGVKNAESF